MTAANAEPVTERTEIATFPIAKFVIPTGLSAPALPSKSDKTNGTVRPTDETSPVE